ncbi:MAG TPA: HlyD family type I secretion periplasmic adaptor subunit, partial [Candidatus Megaira endosymbiont of Hartmannula sinica]|nr:HlyD family type I secretion periplasmic adaptor subunit [Candidatus Megaera endosymbiont of Hartmannula sinica]
MSDNNKIDKQQLMKLLEAAKQIKEQSNNNNQTNTQNNNSSDQYYNSLTLKQKILYKYKYIVNLIKSFSFKGILVKILSMMDRSIKYIDRFVSLISNNKKKINNDVIADARSPILFGFSVIFIFVIFGGLWASFAPLDSAAVAVGMVVSDSKKRIINHLEGGILHKIYVKIGDTVQKDQKLLSFDYTRTKSDYESILSQYRTLLASESRLMAQLNGDEKVTYSDFLLNDLTDKRVVRIIDTQNNLFISKEAIRKGDLDSLKQKMKQINKQIDALNIKKISTKKTLLSIREKLKSTEKLYKKGFTNKLELLEIEARESNAVSDVANIDAETDRQNEEIIKTNIEILNINNKYIDESLKELKEVQVSLSQARERYYQLKNSLDRSIVRSPVDGIVNNINFYTVGSTIPSSQPIMEISPLNDKLIIEARLSPKNIDSVTIGLKAKVKFSAFKSRTTPSFKGVVIS